MSNERSTIGFSSALRTGRGVLLLAVLLSLASLVAFLPVLFPKGLSFSSPAPISLNALKSVGAEMPVRIAGIVTFANERERFYYLQDETAGIRIYPYGTDPLPQPGDKISLRAVVKDTYNAAIGRRSVSLDRIEIERRTRAGLPSAKVKPIAALIAESTVHEATRVQTSGIVRAARRDGEHVLLEIGDNGLRLPIKVLDPSSTLTREGLLDAHISVRGVVQIDYFNPWEENIARNNELGPLVQVAGPAELELLQRAPSDVLLAPSVRALITQPEWMQLGHRVRIHGIVVRAETPQILLIDNGGLIMPVETPRASEYAHGDAVEAIGWPTLRRFTVTLQRAEVTRIPPASLEIAAPEPPRDLALMTSIAAIKALPSELAARAYPVDIEAVLTNIHHQRDCFFIQVGTDGIYVDASDLALQSLRPGQRVRLRGVTWSGGYAPVIIHPRIEVLGEGALPRAQRVDPELAPSGAYDSEWVEIEGLVRPIQPTDMGYLFSLITPLGPVGAIMVNAQDESEWRGLVDARVRARGVFATSFTSDRVLIGYRIYIDSPKSLEVVRPAPVGTAAIPLKPSSELLRFTSDEYSARRARVQGIVTLRAHDMLYIEDSSGSLRIESSDRSVDVGDRIEAIGYPNPSEHGPILSDAMIRKLGEKGTIEPPLVTPDEILSNDMDNRLVAIEARLLNQVVGATQQTLVLHDGYTTFNANLNAAVPLESLREGSILRVVGVCAVQRQRPLFRDFTSYPVSFRLIMRSPQDVSVVHAAPWWSLRQAWPALALLTLSICLALVWVVSLRKRVQTQTAEIDTQRAFLRQIIDMCPNFIFVKDRGGRFALVNRALAEAHGRKPEEMLGKTDIEIGMKEAEARAFLRDDIEVMESKREKIIPEEPHTDRSGRQLWMRTVKRPLIAQDGAATHVLGVANDITLHKQVEATLQKARAAAEAANQAKSEFLASMSHEIRTPLNGILGMSELCLDTELSREQREYIETVKLSADGLLNVINDILDFSKIEAGQLELDRSEFDLRETVDAALKTLALRAHQKGLELACDIAPDVPERALGDPNRLRQVLLNLIGNAIKFTAQGEVIVSARVETDDDLKRVLRFTVRDTGIGIPADRQQQIFKPFVQADSSTTRQYGGTGLGLTISNRLVTMMGGRIWLESEPGKGSAFHFTIALDDAEGSVPLSVPTFDRVRVLVVDDNQTNRRILSETLARWGVRALDAGSAGEALAALETAADEGDPVRVMLIDLGMPTTDGLELIERMRERGIAATPIMMLTASGQREDAARCRALGVTRYLVKPVRASELRDTLTHVLTEDAPAVPEVASTSRTSRGGAASAGLNILLAEDNPVNQLVMQRLLVKRGHRVTIAGTGKAAIEATERDAFDLVIMDVQMPEIDGFEATREIRRREAGSGKRLPIVALTAHAMSGDRERCLESGMDGYMTKPIDPRELDRLLSSYTPGSAASGAEASATS